jgi:hypothetical protein
MQIFSDFIAMVIEIIKVSFVINLILNYKLKKEKWKYVVCTFTLLSIITIANVLEYGEAVSYSGTVMLFTLLTTFLIFDEKYYRIIAGFLPVYLCISCIDIFCAKLVALLFTKSIIITGNNLWNLIYNVCGMIIVCSLALIVNRLSKSKSRRHINREWYIVLLGVIICDMLALGYSVLRIDTLSQQQYVFGFLYAVVCISVIVGLYVIVFLVNSGELYKVNAQFNRKLMQKQQEYYQRVAFQDERLKRFRHEYRNHVRCLRILTEKKDTTELMEYINKMDEVVNASIYQYDTGNSLVNCILSDIEYDFGKSGIRLKVEGRFPADIQIDNLDMSILISNAVLNAFEAAQKVIPDSNKLVLFRIKSTNDMIYIEIINPVIEKVLISNKLIETSKEDKRQHGYGIPNIKECLHKYNGYLEYDCTDHQMTTKILMNGRPNVIL